MYMYLDRSGATSSPRADYNWNLEVQHSKGPWQLLYTLSENECFPIDAENASFINSTKPGGLFWNNVICVRHLSLDDLDESGKAQAYTTGGLAKFSTELKQSCYWKYVMIGNEVKRCIGKSSVTVRTLRNEGDRIRAIREIFEVDVPDDAYIYIRGRSPALVDARFALWKWIDWLTPGRV